MNEATEQTKAPAPGEIFQVNILWRGSGGELKPQPGAEETFQWLKEKNILVVLNTGYNKQTATAILEKLGWQTGKQIDGLITASDVENNRPKPDMILLAMEKFGIENDVTVKRTKIVYFSFLTAPGFPATHFVATVLHLNVRTFCEWQVLEEYSPTFC